MRPQTPRPFDRGTPVCVREPNIRAWYGTVVDVKFSPASGWWVGIRDDATGLVSSLEAELVEEGLPA